MSRTWESPRKSHKVARLKASKLPEAPEGQPRNAKYTEKCIFSRVSEATLGSFPVYKGFKNMGKSTQKVGKGDLVSNSFSSLLSQSHGKSRQVARLKASKLQEAPNCLVFRSNARDLLGFQKQR